MNEAKAKRVFIAIPAPDSLQAEVEIWREGYAGLPVRWLAGKNLHITLVPPWYENDVQAQISKIKNVKARPFGIIFDRVEYGPDLRRPRLIWAGGGTPKELVALKQNIEDALVTEPAASQLRGEPRLGGPRREKRPLSLHLTLARFRLENFSQFPVKRLDAKIDWRAEVKSFALMETHLSPQGADYEVLEEIPLL